MQALRLARWSAELWLLLTPCTRRHADIKRYTDRYRPEEQEAPSIGTVRLQEETQPQAVWKSFIDGEERREKAKGECCCSPCFSPVLIRAPLHNHSQPKVQEGKHRLGQNGEAGE